MFLSNVQRDMAWGFQKSYYTSSLLKGLQSCDLSKLEVKKNFKLRGQNSNLLNDM